MSSKDFYLAFEEKYRGSREAIKNRLKVYLPFVANIKEHNARCNAVDLGCGRGEWLELLKDIGVSAHGIDLDDGMLTACRQLGLSVETGEAVAFLKGLPSESQVIVSGFHIAEHIQFEQLHELVHEALRVLKPAGLLILETPNPENIVVGTSNFYIDPSHQKPIPYQLLSFLTEYYGFYRTKVIRLQESPELAQCDSPTLWDVIGGASPDYAVIAQKTASDNILICFDSVFTTEYGLSLSTLADNFDMRIRQMEVKTQQAEVKAQQAEVKAQQAEAIAQQAEAIAQQAEVKAQHAETSTLQAETMVSLLTGSRSWRLTRPLRLIATWGRRTIKPIISAWLKPIVFFILRTPCIAVPIKRFFKKSAFATRVAKRLVYGGYAGPPLFGNEISSRFTWEQDCGELSVETILSRIKSEVAQSGKEKRQ